MIVEAMDKGCSKTDRLSEHGGLIPGNYNRGFDTPGSETVRLIPNNQQYRRQMTRKLQWNTGEQSRGPLS